MFGLSPSIVTVIEVVAVFTGALSGALLARRKAGYDIVGMCGLALSAGLGGSITRDVLLQHGTPLALMRLTYLLTVGAAILVSWFWGHYLGAQTDRAILLLDAIGLGWFAVAGTLRCLGVGLEVVSAMLLGVIGAVGGGVVRDVLSGEVPAVFRRGELYALAALAGIVVLIVSRALGLPELACAAAGIFVGSGVRLLSMHLGWRSPEPFRPGVTLADPGEGQPLKGRR
ncbi:trimeric intracellular cation channel family protein [Chondromyces crocatus]|uniref:Membrane protein n=1 Tax=Chondromyces crocatus TaxID=52 RepID=A0A0K1EAL2_CHOCO|nr:TRIC cation channel family protein [Chondromyces crocatus]AKT37598.1 membrane protein [Chondromyces crocatus]